MNKNFSSVALGLDPALILEAAGMTPDPWQAKILRSRPKQLILNVSRQAGKSTVVAGSALDEALANPPALVLLLSPSLRQSGELFRTVMTLYRKIAGSFEPEAESSLRVELPNGSRIIALPGADANTIRGFASVSLLVIDEAARVSDELYRAVRPMLAVSGGRIACLSTPFGKRGFFFHEWTEAEGWERVRITADQCPRISKEFLEQERRSMPENFYRQEYMCNFAEMAGAVFAFDDIQRALSDQVEPLFATVPAGITEEVRPLFSLEAL
jgi:Terminase large subunit, T4likevirus-type, N-terminal